MTKLGPVVSNSSPLIALDRIRQLDLLRSLFGGILIPQAVAHEVFTNSPPPSWLCITPVEHSGGEFISATLGAGERQAIALALEQGARLIILDDLPARRLAASRGLHLIGTAGIVLAAKKARLIPHVAPLLNDLLAVDFRLSPRIVAMILDAAGESMEA